GTRANSTTGRSSRHTCPGCRHLMPRFTIRADRPVPGRVGTVAGAVVTIIGGDRGLRRPRGRRMIYRVLGRTGIRISALSFGAGRVSGLMTDADADARRATVARAIEVGVNWFDTAPGYGQGRSEANLGQALAEVRAVDKVHLATKVRLPADALGRIGEYVCR